LFALKACDPSSIGVQNFGSIVGRVYDAKTLKAIPGKILVSATGCNNPVYANPDGTFLLTQVAEGAQTVSATAPGYVTQTVQVEVSKGQRSDAGTIPLTSASATQ
jgi:hypothetical protein